MLKRLLNECLFTLKIHTVGPVLVKSGYAMVSGPDMTPVQTYRDNTLQVYLPGSSLKGVFRSHIEKIIRTLKDDIVCNPFVRMTDSAEKQDNQLVCPDYVNVSCSDKFEVRRMEELRIRNRRWRRLPKKENLLNEDVYLQSCPACRLFGSSSFIGRVAISDAYLTEDSQQRTEQRDGVGIDRFTGGAANKAKFDLEVVSSGVTFETNIYMRNFEVWQLGMLMLIVQDLEDGLIRIGSGKSRGLGSVKGEISEVQVNYINAENAETDDRVLGLGKLLKDNSYGTKIDDHVRVQPTTEKRSGIRRITTFSNDDLKCLRQAAVNAFVNKIDFWEMPKTMKFENLQFQQVGGNG